MPISLSLGLQTRSSSPPFSIYLGGVPCSVSVRNQSVALEPSCRNDPLFLWQIESFPGLLQSISVAVSTGPLSEVWLLKPGLWQLAATHWGPRRALEPLLNWEVLFGWISVVNFLILPLEHLSCCTALPSEVPKRPLIPHVRGFPACRNLLSFRTPFPRAQVPILKSFVALLVSIFCPTSFQGDWFALLEVWGPLSAFRRCSVGVALCAGCFSIYLWGRIYSPHPILLSSWRSSWSYGFYLSTKKFF